LKPEAVWDIEQGLPLSAVDVGRAMARQEALFARLREFMERYEFFACAVNQVPPFPIEWRYPTEIAGVPMEHYIAWMKSAYYISFTGLPAISVPAGFTSDDPPLPVGLQIVAPWQQDLAALQLAHAFEQATGHWRTRPPLAND
jgi:amidase